MASKVDKFMENPSLQELLALKRINWLMWLVVQEFQLKKYFKKQQILDEIIVNLVDNETLEEEEVMEYVSKEEVSEAVKIKQIDLDLQREIEEKKRKRVAERNRRDKNDYWERKTRKRNPNTKKRNSVTERN